MCRTTRSVHRTDTGAAEGGHDLLVDAVGPSDVVAEREQPDVIDDGLAAAAVGAGVAGTSHHVPGRLARLQAVEQHRNVSRRDGSITSSASSQKA